MNRPDSDPLLHDIFAGDELGALRHASLEQGLVVLRRRRRLRLALRAGTAAVAALLLGLSLAPRFVATPAEFSARASAASPAAPQVAVSAPKIKIISDRELLALFQHQSVALIGAPGRQQLVVFSKSSAAALPH
jgi:hypothetical protein